MKSRMMDRVGMKFFHLYGKRITIHQIPGVALKFSLNIGDQAGRAVDPQGRPAPKCDPQERIEADEVVHMSVRDENVLGTQETGRTQRVVLAQIEQQGAFGPAHFDEQAGIAEDIIDEVTGE